MEFRNPLVPLAIIILIIVFFSLFPIGLWIEAVASGVHVSISSAWSACGCAASSPSKTWCAPLIKAPQGRAWPSTLSTSWRPICWRAATSIA